MRLVPVLLIAFAPALIHVAAAQVSVNNQALDSLGNGAPAAPSRHATPTHRPPPHRPPPHRPPAHAAKPAHTHEAEKPAEPGKPQTTPAPAHPSATAVPAVPHIPPPAIPATPPALPAIAPPVVEPTHPVPPPPPVPVVNAAPGAATPITGGVRITFGTTDADLNPATLAAVQNFAKLVKDQPVGIDVIATATGAPEDPSTPRRLSLSRALAVRAVLINEGIPSTRIYPRALGPNPGDGPPDRVDLVEHHVTAAPDTEPKP